MENVREGRRTDVSLDHKMDHRCMLVSGNPRTSEAVIA